METMNNVGTNRQVNILIIGQTPPPFHGQALSILRLIEGKYDRIRIFYVRLAYSKEINEVSSFRLRKIFHLIGTIVRVFSIVRREKIDVIHYPPAGGKLVPIFRDIIFLFVVRRLFKYKKFLFFFHASGLYERIIAANPILRYFALKAYSRPDAIILLSSHFSPICKLLQAKNEFIIPHGIVDQAVNKLRSIQHAHSIPKILYVGMLHEEKGILDLLNAAVILKNKGLRYSLQFVGEFASSIFAKNVEAFVKKHNLTDEVQFLGKKIDDAKWMIYNDSDIFCFPTYYSGETLGLVVLEAMMFSLPVVATRWCGPVDTVVDGETGYLVPIKSPENLAQRLSELLENPEIRIQMGHNGRERYLKEYSSEKWYKRIEEAFVITANG